MQRILLPDPFESAGSEKEKRVKEGSGQAVEKVKKLTGLVGIGVVSASKFVME